MNRTFLFATFLLIAPGASFAQEEVELPPLADIIPEYRGNEALNTINGTYELHLPTVGVTALIDASTNSIYISNSSGTYTIPITPQILNQAGVSLSEFQEMMSEPGNNFIATWTEPNNLMGQQKAAQNRELISSGEMFPCAFVPCSPWQGTQYGELGSIGSGPFVGPSMFWDRVQGGGGGNGDPPPSQNEKDQACANVKAYSEIGAIEAFGAGLTCGAVAAAGITAIPCVSALVKVAFTAYKRSKNQKICRGYY